MGEFFFFFVMERVIGLSGSPLLEHKQRTARGDDNGNDEAVDAEHARHDDLTKREKRGGSRKMRARGGKRGRGRWEAAAASGVFLSSLSLTGTMLFMTSSGRMTPMDAMPTPDLAVP